MVYLRKLIWPAYRMFDITLYLSKVIAIEVFFCIGANAKMREER